MDKTEDITIEKVINCSFCGKGRHQVATMVEGPVIAGNHIYICNECVSVTHEILQTDIDAEYSEKAVKKKKEKVLTPEQIKAHLVHKFTIFPPKSLKMQKFGLDRIQWNIVSLFYFSTHINSCNQRVRGW